MKIKNPKHIKSISIVLFFFILCGISFVSAFSSSISAESSTSPSSTFSVYFVSTAKSQLEAEALSLAKDVSKNNGAGYVWKKDNYFYTISSAYENKNDADLVSAEMTSKKINNEVFEISFPNKTISSPVETPEARSTFNAGLNIFMSTYRTLFDISVCIDTKLYEETVAHIELNHVLARADEVMRNFDIVFIDNNESFISNLKSAIQNLNTSLNALSQENEHKETSMLSQIRYCYCDILSVYFNFLAKIN